MDLANYIKSVIKKPKPGSFVMESIHGRKSGWKNRQAFIDWAKSHGYKTSKQDSSANFWTLRQRNPNDFQSLHTICINPGRKTKPGSDKCIVQGIGGPLKN